MYVHTHTYIAKYYRTKIVFIYQPLSYVRSSTNRKKLTGFDKTLIPQVIITIYAMHAHMCIRTYIRMTAHTCMYICMGS